MAGEIDSLDAQVKRIERIRSELARSTDLATRQFLTRALRDAKTAFSQRVDAVKKAAAAGDPEALELVRVAREHAADDS